MGQHDENVRSSREDGASTPPDPSGEPVGVPSGDDVPYVPRVFAFDPTVSAELQDEPQGELTVADVTAPSTPPVAAGGAAAAAGAWERPGASAGPATWAAGPRADQTSEAKPASASPAWRTSAIGAASVPVADEPTRVVSPVPPTSPARAEPAAPVASAAPRVPVERAEAFSADATPAAGRVFPPMAKAGAPAPASKSAPDASGPASGSPLDGFDGEPEHRRGWVRGLAWAGVAVIMLGGLYVAAQWYYADKVPHDTAVAGTDISGMTSSEAVAALNKSLGTKAKEPVTVSAGDSSATLDPAAAGMSFDAAATVDGLTSFSLSPARLWAHISGGSEVEPAVKVDQTALNAQVASLVPVLEVAPVDGDVQFVDGKPVATAASAGVSVDAEAAPAEISAKWLRTTNPIALGTKAVEPAITQAETDAALAQAQKVVSAPVTVAAGDQTAEIPPEALAAAASFTADNGALALGFNGDLLVKDVVSRTKNLLSDPDPAKFVFTNGKPTITGGKPGTTLDPATLSVAVNTAAASDARSVTAQLVQSDPKDTAAALQQLGVSEQVSSFNTPLTSDTIRTKNIRRGLEIINGTLVKPGEQFSLLQRLGKIDAAHGFVKAGIIEGGVHVEGWGGGLSQVATTTYNAAYEAGVKIDAFKPHSFWFTRYPAGRESTIADPSVDVKFTNDTTHGVLIQAYIDGNDVHVNFWSTKYFTVKASDGGHTNVTSAGVVHKSGPDCEAVPKGQDGFTITNYRKVFTLDGALNKDETEKWTYKPDNAVVCDP